MKKFRPLVTSPNGVIFTREKDVAIIQYEDPAYATPQFRIGPELEKMADREIVELCNDSLRAQAQLAAEYKHTAVEIPLGSPQIKYSTRLRQWLPRGKVLRCLIGDTAEGEREPVITVDDHELTLSEFGRLVCSHAGWGLRLEFVPKDEIHRRPSLEVREPGR